MTEIVKYWICEDCAVYHTGSGIEDFFDSETALTEFLDSVYPGYLSPDYTTEDGELDYEKYHEFDASPCDSCHRSNNAGSRHLFLERVI